MLVTALPPAGYFLVPNKKVTKEIGIGRTHIGIYTLQTEYFPQYKKHLLLWCALQFCIGDFSSQRSPATAEILCVFQGGRGLLRRKRYMQNRVNPYVGPPNGRFGQMRPLMYPPPLCCECGESLPIFCIGSRWNLQFQIGGAVLARQLLHMWKFCWLATVYSSGASLARLRGARSAR